MMSRNMLFVCFLAMFFCGGIPALASNGEEDKFLELLGRYIETSKSAQRVKASPARDVAQRVKASPARDVAQRVKASPARDVAQRVEASPARDVAQRVGASPARDVAQRVKASPTRDVRDDILINVLRKLLTPGAGEHQRGYDRQAYGGQPQQRWDLGETDPGGRATFAGSTTTPMPTTAPVTTTAAPRQSSVPAWAQRYPSFIIDWLRRMGYF